MSRSTVLVALLALVLGGCAAPSDRFVSSDDRDVIMRVPRDWNVMRTDDVLKSFGVDPASRTTWAAFFDADRRPSPTHLKADSTPQPVMSAQTIDVPEDQRATVTDAQLRDLALPSTQEVRAQWITTGTLVMLRDTFAVSRAQRAAHVRFALIQGSTREIYEQIAVTDPQHRRVHLVSVHCSPQCFETQGSQIGDVVGSLTLKPR